MPVFDEKETSKAKTMRLKCATILCESFKACCDILCVELVLTGSIISVNVKMARDLESLYFFHTHTHTTIFCAVYYKI